MNNNLINGKTEQEILEDFFTLVAKKEWFYWVDEPELLGHHTQICVDEILTEDFEEFAQGHFNFDWEQEQYENMQDMYRSAGL